MSEIKLDRVQVMTTSTCSANCVFCPYIESWHKAYPGRMDHEIYRKILRDLEPIKTFQVFCPYLMNEPTTDPRIFDWVREFYEVFPDKFVEFSMNPSMLSEEAVNKICETFKNHNHEIIISFQGIDKKTFEYIMQLPYEWSLEGVINLVRRAEGLKITLHGLGRSIDRRICYFTDDQYQNFWSHTLSVHGIKPETVKIAPGAFHDRAGNIKRSERDAYKNCYGIVRQIDEEHPFYCLRIDYVFHVLWNGDVVLCCMDYRREVPMGNVRCFTIQEFYQTHRYLEVKYMVTGRKSSPPEFICKRCIRPGG